MSLHRLRPEASQPLTCKHPNSANIEPFSVRQPRQPSKKYHLFQVHLRLWPFTTAQCKGVRPHMSLASRKRLNNETSPILELHLQLSPSRPLSRRFGLCLCLWRPSSPSTHPRWLQRHPPWQQSAKRFASPRSLHQASHGSRATSPPPVQMR